MTDVQASETEQSAAVESVPGPIRALLSVFEGALAGVTFPGVDGDSLATTAEQMQEISKSLAEATQRVDSLREELSQKREALLRDAKKALDYAKVFASDQPELMDAIDGIELDALVDTPKKKKPRRAPRKKKPTDAKAASGSDEGDDEEEE